jgi:predicted TIM-barrel fold metal-dependent hydrolase
MLLLRLACLATVLGTAALGAYEMPPPEVADLKLKDFVPVSIYRVPQTSVPRAKFPAVDMHAHDYAETPADVDRWVADMDAANVAKSIVMTMAIGEKFDDIVKKYAHHPGRFEIWCDFDYTGFDQPGWIERALAELDRCHRAGARGVGEVTDKGMGFRPKPANLAQSALGNGKPGMHANDPRMKPLFARCAELGMPINIHVAEDAWMYLPPDGSNDGLMNGAKWRVDLSRPGILDHDQLIASLEEAVRDNPKTTFIACHLANCCSDLGRLGRMLDAYPNLYSDLGGRWGEIAPIPRFVHAFLEKYSTRILYGTDSNPPRRIYPVSFRILETADDHFYETQLFNYHWPLYGLALSDGTLQNIYRGNSEKVLMK